MTLLVLCCTVMHFTPDFLAQRMTQECLLNENLLEDQLPGTCLVCTIVFFLALTVAMLAFSL